MENFMQGEMFDLFEDLKKVCRQKCFPCVSNRAADSSFFRPGRGRRKFDATNVSRFIRKHAWPDQLTQPDIASTQTVTCHHNTSVPPRHFGDDTTSLD